MNEIKIDLTLVFSGPIDPSDHQEILVNVQKALKKFRDKVGLAPASSSVLTRKIYLTGPNNIQTMIIL